MEERERRQILLARQHVTEPSDKLTALRDLNGVQAQFPSYARHGLALRCREPLGADWGDGLVKSWTIRGTMHVFREADLPLFLHRGRTHYLREVDRFVDDEFASRERKEHFAQVILDLVDRGVTGREELRSACFARGMTEGEERSFFNSWGGLLRAMCEEGLLCYAAGADRTFRRCPAFTPMDRDAARLELLRRYFTHFGPATVKDAAYYFGCPQRDVKGMLDRLPVERVTCGGRECFFMDDGRRDFPEIPDCALLAGFDQLLLGYDKKESVFLSSEYIHGIFSLSGIVMPAVLLDGQVAGRWKVSGKRCTVTPFRTLTAKEKRAVDREVRRWFPAVGTIAYE